ncbi:MAG TPA: CPBP family intramembrane glutamic endopeptidase [bacterium]
MIKTFWAELRKFDPEPALIIVYSTFVLLYSLYFGRTRIFLPGEPFLEKLLVMGILYGFSPVILMLIFHRKPADYGISIGIPRIWLKDIGFLLLIMLVILVVSFKFTGFKTFYPLYKRAGHDFNQFLIYEAIQLFHMFAWEFFFRGFMLFGLSKKMDPRLAILIQTIPFAMMHFRKPPLEAYGSIFAGVFQGVVAVRGRSFLPCAILHFSVALAADVLGMIF